MAGPLLPIAALFGASMLANEIADDRVEAERQRKLQAERLRQRKLQDQADANMRQQLEEQSRPSVEAEQTQQAAQREEKYAEAAPQPDIVTASYQTSASAPTEVKSEIARNVVAAMRRGKQQAKAQARLGGMQDANQTGAVDLLRGGQDMRRIGNESRASSQILPYELSDANQKGEGWRTIGDIAGLAAQAYGLYGMMTPPGAAATGAYGSTGAARNLFAP